MTKFGIVILGMVIFLIHESTLSQSIDRRFHHLTIRDGLSQSRVQAIHQDSYGYLWVGTSDGLNQFNGYEFTVYRADSDDPGSISDNFINVIYEDSEGVLWIGTQNGGLMQYERESDSFRAFNAIIEEWGWATLSSNMVTSLLEDRHGNFWVGTGYGLNIMNRQSGTFRRLTPENEDEPTPSSTVIHELFESSDGVLWLGTGNGLEYYDYESGEFHRFTGFDDADSQFNFGVIQAIHEDREGILWVGSEGNGLFAIDRQNERITQYQHDPNDTNSLSGNTVFSIIEDSSGELWIGTGNDGINIFNRSAESFYRFQENRTDPFSINNNGITTIFESREDIVWIGTNDSGLNYYEVNDLVFQTFVNEPSNTSSLNNNIVQSIQEINPNEIWIGTDGGGLNIFNPMTLDFIHSDHNPDDLPLPNSDVILDIHKKDSNIYLATYGNGVEVYDMESESFNTLTEITGESDLLGSLLVFDIYESRDGHLWFSKNSGGVTEYDPDTGEFKRYQINPDDPTDPTSLQNNDIRVVFEDHLGAIWIGGYGSNLHKLDRESGEIEVFDINQDSPYFASVVQTIVEDSDSRLWMGTAGGGLKYFDREINQLVHVASRDNHLPSNVIHLIVEDERGHLWISSNNGITHMNREAGEYVTYNIEQGLNYSEFTPRSGSVMSDGTMYFGGVSGFIRFHPDEIREDSTSIPVVFTELLIFNETVYPGEDSPLERDISVTNDIVLPHSSTMITFEYAALNYSATKTNQYAYRLLGFEENWNYVGSQRIATFTNLSPGEYELQVRSSNKSGIWSDEYTSFMITITPPFWQKAWFILLVFGLIVGSITMILWYRFRLIRMEKITLERIILDRTRELRSSNETKDRLFSIIAHDLRNYAGNIMGIADLLKESSENKNMNETKEYTDLLKTTSVQFDDFLKNLLEWARYQTDKIKFEPKLFNVRDVILQVMDQAEPNTKNKKIELVSDIEDELKVYGDPNLFAIVIFNLLSNAIKFSHSGEKIEIKGKKLNQNEVEISVCDHGVGMTEETIEKLLSGSERFTKPGTSGEKGTGIGFDLCRDFINRNGGELSIDSEIGKGTTIRFTLPASEENLRKVIDSDQ